MTSSTPAADATAPAKPRRGGRDIHEAHRVATPLELLFDLVFVVAIAASAAGLHHAIVEGHWGHGFVGFLLAFFAIWWAWMNYSWMASAYDSEDLPFRLLTMLQMAGALVFATGVGGLFEGHFAAGIAGYVLMRLALAAQWLRAGSRDPSRRRTCTRYAIGVVAVQALWVAILLLPAPLRMPAVPLLVVAELAVPVWAESAGATPWHAHHIAERYALMTIIVLGECILGSTNSLASMVRAEGLTLQVFACSLATATLVVGLWWVYYLLPSGEALHHHRERCWGWGYGHFIVFASLAAMGAGLEVVADSLAAGPGANAHGPSVATGITVVGLAQAVYLLTIWGQWVWVTRARDPQTWLTALCIALTLGAVALAWAGLPVTLCVFALCVGPWVAISYNELGRRRRAESFAVR